MSQFRVRLEPVREGADVWLEVSDFERSMIVLSATGDVEYLAGLLTLWIQSTKLSNRN